MKTYLIKTTIYYNITETNKCLSARTDYHIEAETEEAAVIKAIWCAKQNENFESVRIHNEEAI